MALKVGNFDKEMQVITQRASGLDTGFRPAYTASLVFALSSSRIMRMSVKEKDIINALKRDELNKLLEKISVIVSQKHFCEIKKHTCLRI